MLRCNLSAVGLNHSKAKILVMFPRKKSIPVQLGLIGLVLKTSHLLFGKAIFGLGSTLTVWQEYTWLLASIATTMKYKL